MIFPRVESILVAGLYHEPGTNRHGVNVDDTTIAILNALVSSELFILQIYTNFSGTFHDVRSRTGQQCKKLPRSSWRHRLFTDWHGNRLTDR